MSPQIRYHEGLTDPTNGLECVPIDEGKLALANLKLTLACMDEYPSLQSHGVVRNRCLQTTIMSTSSETYRRKKAREAAAQQFKVNWLFRFDKANRTILPYCIQSPDHFSMVARNAVAIYLLRR